MNVIEYDKDKHKDSIDSWCDAWEVSRLPDSPILGLVVEGIVAVFYYRVETCNGEVFAQCAISNPAKNKEERLDAIGLAVGRINFDVHKRSRGL